MLQQQQQKIKFNGFVNEWKLDLKVNGCNLRFNHCSAFHGIHQEHKLIFG